MMRSVLSIVLMLVSAPVWAQDTAQVLAKDTLDLDRLLSVALEKNYNIRMAKNNRAMAFENYQQGKYRFLPRLGLDGNGQYSIGNTSLKINGDPPREIDQAGAVSINYGATLGVNYTLFSGLGNWNNLNLKQSQLDLQEVATYRAMENTVVAVMNAYYQAVLAQLNLKVTRKALALSRDRLERQQARQELGQGNRLSVLSAQVDLNADSVQLAQQNMSFEQAIWNLAYVVNQDLGDPKGLAVQNNMELGDTVSFKAMKATMMSANIDLIHAQALRAVSGWELEVARSTYSPNLGLNAGATYTGQENEVGLLEYNRNLNGYLGATLSWNVFNGLQQRTQVQNAKIRIDNARVQEEETQKRLTRDLLKAHSQLQTNRRIMQQERRNYQTAQTNFEQVKRRHELGQATTTQIREAQLNLVRTSFGYSRALYQAKRAEVQILQLSGTLIGGFEDQ